MTVARILAAKGGEVVSVQPHRTIQEAVRLLAARRIGALVVAGADGAIVGILSERDIVRALATDSVAALDAPVTRYMTANVVTTTRRARICEIKELMTNGRFRHLPVVENGRLAGIISIGDVVKHHIEEIETEHQAMREYIATA